MIRNSHDVVVGRDDANSNVESRAKDNENSKQISLAGFLADKDRKTDRTMHLNAWFEHLQGDAGSASC